MTTGSVRILARLLKPIEVSPYIPPAPTGHDVPGCTARSGSPSWKISDLDWRTGGLNQTWTPVLFPQWYIRGAGMVRFNITNEANQQKYTCAWMSRYSETSNVTLEHSFTSPFLTDLTGVWFSCNVHSLYQDGNLTHNYETETSARLISAERRILINQTWYCDDEGSASP
jgi:hypothetical protein